MNCPNCQIPFVEEKAGKFRCVTCGWFEKVGKEWQGCEAPEPEPVSVSEPTPPSDSEPEPEPEPQSKRDPGPAALEPNPAKLEPDPAAHEPDPAALEPGPAAQEPHTNCSDHSVKKFLGGILTVTDVDE